MPLESLYKVDLESLKNSERWINQMPWCPLLKRPEPNVPTEGGRQHGYMRHAYSSAQSPISRSLKQPRLSHVVLPLTTLILWEFLPSLKRCCGFAGVVIMQAYKLSGIHPWL